MWETKYFRNERQMNAWINENKNKYRIDVIFVNNGYAVEYKPIKSINV